MSYYWLGGKRHREQDVFFEEALDPGRWTPGDENRWDTCWFTGMPPRDTFRATGPGKTINHIPGNAALTVKSRLWRTVRGLRERLSGTGAANQADLARVDFAPRVYSMPEDYHELQRVAREEPDTRWLLKPRNAARGKDIRLLEDVAEAPVERRWMVQEYLGNPHLMNDRKYVLRLYVLITSVEPLRVYLYEQGFAKLASVPYSEAEQGNPYAYLTNPDVNARNEDAESPVVFVDLETYRRWLREQGHDDAPLFARLREMVGLTCIAARESMRARSRECGADLSSCYEFLGMDCLVDENLRPWLLECNLSPSLGVCAAPADGGDVEEAVKRRMVADLVEAVNLNGDEPEDLPDDPAARLVAIAEAERDRAGGFRPVFPDVDAARFLRDFPFPRLADVVLAEAFSQEAIVRPRAQRWQASEIITDDRLSLYSETQGALYSTNPAAAIIWLQATSGHDPDEIAAGLGDGAAWPVRRQVWDALADWAQAGLLMQVVADAEETGKATTEATAGASASIPPPVTESSVYAFEIRCGAHAYRLRTWSAPAAERLAPLLQPLITRDGVADGLRMDIASSRGGFTILLEGNVVAEGLRLAELAPWLSDAVLRQAAGPGQIAFAGAVIEPFRARSDEEAGAILVARSGADGDDTLPVALGRSAGWGVRGGAVITPEDGRAEALGLPLRVESSSVSDPGVTWCWSGHRGGLIPSNPGGPASPSVISTVLFPSADTDDGHDLLRPAAVDEALAVLLPHMFGDQGRAPDAEAVTRFHEWLNGVARYAVTPRASPDFPAALQGRAPAATNA